MAENSDSPSHARTESKGHVGDMKHRSGLRRILTLALMLSVPLLLAAIGVYYWIESARFATTDNAYVQQNIISISPEVGGRITAVGVRENQQVKQGDLLFAIDPKPYELAVSQANARIAAAQVQVQTLQTDYQVSGVDIEVAKKDIAFAQANFDRQAALMDRGFNTRAQMEMAQNALDRARAELKSAQANVIAKKARLATGAASPGENPDLAKAKVEREQALLDLSRARVLAPAAGRIAQSSRLQIGQMMVSGLPVVSIVADDDSWIEANFKETDLARMKVGQKAEIKIDAYPGVKLHGRVESIGAGTGSEFSVLPAQNANGNWVKVTQRVPVRIAILEKSPRQLIAGISATVSVDLQDDPE